MIWRNTAEGVELGGESGGGIWCWETDAWIHHNTIAENIGRGPSSVYGGGIVMREYSTPLVEQNILAFTEAGGGIFCTNSVTPTIRDNLGWQNLPVEGVGLCEFWWQSDGNVIADPLFCGRVTGDFSLGRGSPALTHPAGPLGAVPVEGCQPVLVERTTWGSIKARYGAR